MKVVVAEMRTRNEIADKSIEKIDAKIDAISTTLNQIIGRESVRAGIYGVIGAIVSGVTVWLLSLIKK